MLMPWRMMFWYNIVGGFLCWLLIAASLTMLFVDAAVYAVVAFAITLVIWAVVVYFFDRAALRRSRAEMDRLHREMLAEIERRRPS